MIKVAKKKCKLGGVFKKISEFLVSYTIVLCHQKFRYFFAFHFTCTLHKGNNLTREVTGGVCQRLKTPAPAPAAKSRCIFVECIISARLLLHAAGMQNILEPEKNQGGNFLVFNI